MVKFTIQKKNITRKSLRKVFPRLNKFGIEFRVRKDGKIFRTFSSRKKAEEFIKKKRRKKK